MAKQKKLQTIKLTKKHLPIYVNVADIFMATLGGRFKSLQELYQNPEKHVERTIACIDSGRVAGGLKHSYCDATDCFLIDCVAVAPDLQQRGFGSMLVNQLETQARESGVSGVRVQADAAVERFYKKLGYTPISSNGDCVWMEKKFTR